MKKREIKKMIQARAGLSNRELLETEASLNHHDLELDAIICSRAGLEIEWANADSETFEGVLDKALDILKEGI